MLQQISNEAQCIENFLKDIQDYSSPIPDNVVKHLLAEGGMNTTDSRVVTTVNIATQKFICDLLSTCHEVAAKRIQNQDPTSTTTEDLQVSDVKEAISKRKTFSNIVSVSRPDYLISLPTENKE